MPERGNRRGFTKHTAGGGDGLGEAFKFKRDRSSSKHAPCAFSKEEDQETEGGRTDEKHGGKKSSPAYLGETGFDLASLSFFFFLLLWRRVRRKVRVSLDFSGWLYYL